MVRGAASVIAVGEATVAGTTVTGPACRVAAGFSMVTLSATSTVDVVADKRLVDASATLAAGRADAFFSTRTVLVADRFFGRCADGAATSVSVSADPASVLSAASA